MVFDQIEEITRPDTPPQVAVQEDVDTWFPLTAENGRVSVQETGTFGQNEQNESFIIKTGIYRLTSGLLAKK